jgi:hypothetical protein
MYFIPREKLQDFLVPDEQAREVEQNLSSLRQEAEVSGFSFDNPIGPANIGLDNPQAPSMDGGDTVEVGSTGPVPGDSW